MKIKLLFLFASLSMLQAGYAQDIKQARLTWTAAQVTDIQASSSKAMECDFITDGLLSVTWKQKQGALSTAFHVVSTEGTWDNISSIGSFSYTLENNGRVCRMKLERNASGVFVLIDFLKDGQSVSSLRFTIDTIE